MKYSDRLRELGVQLPPLAKPVGFYIPATQVDRLVFTSGQLPRVNGELVAKGKVPADISIADAQQASKIAAINALAAIAYAVGSIDLIERIVRVGVFVNSGPGFTDQPQVADGASNFLMELFGDNGRHARTAIGVAELPLNAAIELEMTVLLRA